MKKKPLKHLKINVSKKQKEEIAFTGKIYQIMVEVKLVRKIVKKEEK